jgi:hypothetical protein
MVWLASSANSASSAGSVRLCPRSRRSTRDPEMTAVRERRAKHGPEALPTAPEPGEAVPAALAGEAASSDE